MALVLQVGVCLVFLVLAAFWAGKKLGQRRFFKMEEELKALELSFKHLAEDIEMVASHNIKALDGQCKDLKELLTIADKKCLYANDLLKEVDEGVEALRKRNLNPANALTSIDQGLDKRFRKEVQDTLEEMLKKIVSMNNRISELEENETSVGPEELRSLIDSELTRYLELLEMPQQRHESVAKPAAGRYVDRVAELPASARYFEAAADRPADKLSEKPLEKSPILRSVTREPMPSPSSATVVATPHAAAKAPVPIKELRSTLIDEVVRFPSAVKKTDLGRNIPFAPPSEPNYVVREVLRQYSEGITLPQIARELSMGKGEIELILKIHGEGIKMRNVI